MRIGNVELDSPFIAAPLAGVTDAPTRSIASSMGAALTFSEMVSGKGLMYGNRNTEELLYIRPEEYRSVNVSSEEYRMSNGSPNDAKDDISSNDDMSDGKKDSDKKSSNVGFQIFGREPDVMEWTAKALAGRDNAILDINMGCPVPKIVKNGEGSALMKEPELAARIVEAVCKGTREGAYDLGDELFSDGSSGRRKGESITADGSPGTKLDKPVTVKMRAGWDDDSINAVEVALACEEAGAAAVTIHGRTRMQYYSGSSDRDIIRQVKRELKIPVIGNGDIFSAEDAVRMMDETGCDGVMIARGALGNPWIFREAKALWEGKPVPARPGMEEIYDMMRRHFNMLMEDKGEKRAVFEMRKHVGWYMKGQPHATELRRRVNTINTADELEGVLVLNP